MKKFEYKKSLGQNFLHNQKIVDRIVESGNIDHDDIVLEIGCGDGILTEGILSKLPKKLIVCEIDERCIELMTKRLQNHPEWSRVEIRHQNALEINVAELLAVDQPKVKIIANLPYSVGSRIFVEFSKQKSHISLMILMFQKEVAKRIISTSQSGEDYGLLSVIGQAAFDSKILFDVSPANFKPAPAVTSSVISCKPNDREISSPELEKFIRISRRLFENRRKMIRSYANDLVENFPEYADKRVENLSVDDLLKLTA
jgi:16S rRNA (adenine1518-N6/adenine1519-N6)-dimethyltransferase